MYISEKRPESKNDSCMVPRLSGADPPAWSMHRNEVLSNTANIIF